MESKGSDPVDSVPGTTPECQTLSAMFMQMSFRIPPQPGSPDEFPESDPSDSCFARVSGIRPRRLSPGNHAETSNHIRNIKLIELQQPLTATFSERISGVILPALDSTKVFSQLHREPTESDPFNSIIDSVPGTSPSNQPHPQCHDN